jgi:predicted GIY-YIG superfamily endonuclease
MTERTWLYRFYDKSNVLLYIGITNDFTVRFVHHRRNKEWSGEIWNHSTVCFDTREEAEAAEKSAIQSESPKYNVIYNKKKNISSGRTRDDPAYQIERYIKALPKDVKEFCGRKYEVYNHAYYYATDDFLLQWTEYIPSRKHEETGFITYIEFLSFTTGKQHRIFYKSIEIDKGGAVSLDIVKIRFEIYEKLRTILKVKPVFEKCLPDQYWKYLEETDPDAFKLAA